MDIALGLRIDEGGGLEAFAATVNASYMSQWAAMGLYDDDVAGWGEAFAQVVTRTIVGGGRIHFNLTGLDIRAALRGDPELWVGRYTAWELQQIVRNSEWFAKTFFYLDGAILTTEQADALGVVCS